MTDRRMTVLRLLAKEPALTASEIVEQRNVWPGLRDRAGAARRLLHSMRSDGLVEVTGLSTRNADCWGLTDRGREPRAGLAIEAALGMVEQHPTEIYPPWMALMVGDRPEDQAVAEALNVDFVWAVDWRGGNPMTDPVPGTREDPDLVTGLRRGLRRKLGRLVEGLGRPVGLLLPIEMEDGEIFDATGEHVEWDVDLADLMVAAVNALPGLTKEIEAGRALIEHMTAPGPLGGWNLEATEVFAARKRELKHAYTAAREANTKETP